MANEQFTANAQAAYTQLCAAMDQQGWHYEKHAENLTITCSVKGDDLSMDVMVSIDTERQFVMVLSRLPFVADENKRLDMGVAISLVNEKLVAGSFDYHITKGETYFRMTSSIMDMEVSGEMFLYMINSSCMIIDAYNDKLMMLAKGMVSVQQFAQSINGQN